MIATFTRTQHDLRCVKWRQAVIHAITRQVEESGSDEFTRDQLLSTQLPTITRLTGSKGRTPEQTTSRVLQELRDLGGLEFTDKGRYRARVETLQAHLDLTHPFNNLDVGQTYSRAELQPLALEYGYGRLTAGITPKGTFPATESVVVFADVGGGRYGNFWDDETGDLMYVGEDDSRTYGKEASRYDQNHDKGKNRVLSHQSGLGFPVFLFTRDKGRTAFTYQGIVHVVEYDYYREEGRRVVRYRLRRLKVGSAVLDYEMQARAERDMLSALSTDPSLEDSDEIQETTVYRRYRARAFSIDVRAHYKFHCAVCGEERYNYKDHAEVDAAHIYPVARRGSNDVRNGLALCKFHHWAFDGHLFYIDTGYRLQPTICGADVKGVHEFSGDRLLVVPEDARARPHRIFLEGRRGIVPEWLFEHAK